MSDSIKLKVLTAMMVAGRRIEPGTILTLATADAADALDSGRCTLLDPADRDAVRAARQAAVKAALRREGQPWLQPGVGPAWSRMN